MATLFVTTNTDFRGGPVETNITEIVFQNADTATADFEPAQFGAGLISNTVVITGNDEINRIDVNFAAGGAFSAAGWSFQGWGVDDQVRIFGTSGNQNITGSAGNDFVSGLGGLDHIDSGAGNDTIQITSVGVAAGTTIVGGTEDAGGFDAILIANSGTTDIRPAAISGVERLAFNATGSTAIVGGHQIGAGRITQVLVDAGETATLSIRGGAVDLTAVTFINWGADDTITITAEGALPVLVGSNQRDIINGTGSSLDTITGGLGADTLNGGNSNDKFRYVSNGDAEAGETVNGGAGTDDIVLSNVSNISFVGVTINDVERLDYTAGNSTATFGSNQIGNAAIGFGDFTTVSDSTGVDRLIVNTVAQFADLSGLTFTTWANGTDAISILGSALQDLITGSSQSDIIDGGALADLMGGGLGDDTYVVDVSNDVIIEAAGQGVDTVLSSATYTLSNSQEIENLFLTGPAAINGAGNGLGNVISGNAAANTLRGNGGDDELDGVSGTDTLLGGLGNDTFFVDSADDVVSEFAGEGSDTVRVLATKYTLTAGSHVEFLQALATNSVNALNLTGNALAQTITGTNGVNTLDPGAGAADTLIGRAGNDTYIVRNAGDAIVELAGEGADTILAAVSYNLTANAHVEKLSTTSLVGTAAINLKGNTLAQTVTGNDGANTLDSGGGAVDTLVGRSGNDTYIVRNAGDKITEAAGQGTDTVLAAASYVLAANVSVESLSTTSLVGTGATNLTGNALAQTITGNDGANTLDSGAGAADTLVGRSGNDTYLIRNAGDVVSEAAGQGTDAVLAVVSYVLTANASIETLSTTSLVGTGALNLTGNALVQTITGNDGANVLNGGGGNDTLNGRGGADTFLFNTALNAATNVAAIASYAAADDVIHLENAVFAGLAGGALGAGAFLAAAGATAATAADHRIVYNTTNGALFFDADGVGGAAATQFATLPGAPAITAAEFLVV